MIHRLRSLLCVWLFGLGAWDARPATVTSSPEPPVVDGWDQAVLGTSSVIDKWWVGGAGWGAGALMGQTFTTGEKPVRISAFTFRICESCNAAATKVYAIRLGSVKGNAFTLLHQEKAEQAEAFVTGGYVTWKFDQPIPLHPGTVYGVDVDMVSSTSEWRSGIPYVQRFPVDKLSGGQAYVPGGEGNATLKPVPGDRVFHVDLEASDGSVAPPTPISVNTPAGVGQGKRLAIVGDGLAADPALAASLQQLLGQTHQVRSFGSEGSTVLAGSDKPWSKQPAARDAFAFAPQIVVVHAGVTDTRPANRGRLENLGKDFQDLVISVMQIRGVEAVWLCIPVLTQTDLAAGADAAVLSDQLEIPLRLAAVETGAAVVDLPVEIKTLPSTLSPAQAAAARLAEIVTGRKADLSRLVQDPAVPPAANVAPTPASVPVPAPATTPAVSAARIPAPVPAVKPAAEPEPVRVACVGDALDAGLTTAVEMGKILGKTHDVKSFQAVDTVLLNTGKQSYPKTGKLAEARAFKPHVVVITLAEPPKEDPSYKEITALDRELRLMLNDLLAWSPRPVILLANAVPKDVGPVKAAPAANGKNAPRKEDKRKSSTLPIVERARAAFRLLPADPAAILRDEKLMPKDGKGTPLPALGYARKLAEAVQAADGP